MFFENHLNKNFEALKAQSKEAHLQKLEAKAENIYKDKAYSQENKLLFLGAQVLKTISNLVSFFTCFFACIFVFRALLGYYLALSISLCFCGVLELIKNNLWRGAIKNKLKYNKLSLSITILVLFSGVSIGGSLFGAYIMLDSFKEYRAKGSSLAQDSTNLKELSILNTQITTINRALENTTKGENLQSSTNKRTAKSLSSQLPELQNRKDSLLKKIEAQEAKTTILLQKTQLQKQEEEDKLRAYLVIFALLFELTYIGANLYSFYYLFRVYIDSPKKPLKTVLNHQKRGINGEIREKLEPSQRPQIGYKTEDKSPIKYIVHNKKRYTKQSIKQNISSFKSKLQRYKDDPQKEERYKAHLRKWEGYLKQVQD